MATTVWRVAACGASVPLLLLGALALAQAPQLPEGPGRDQFVQLCGRCHEAQRSAALRLTREGWERVVADMIGRGAVMTEDERTAVVDYLATHFLGEAAQPLNINTATNIDLEAVAGLTRKEAAALKEWLKQHGPCKSLEDLKKAPVDYKKIEERKDFLMCFEPLLPQ